MSSDDATGASVPGVNVALVVGCSLAAVILVLLGVAFCIWKGIRPILIPPAAPKPAKPAAPATSDKPADKAAPAPAPAAASGVPNYIVNNYYPPGYQSSGPSARFFNDGLPGPGAGAPMPLYRGDGMGGFWPASRTYEMAMRGL